MTEPKLLHRGTPVRRGPRDAMSASMRWPKNLSTVGLVLLGSWVLALFARVELSLGPVPVTGQTLALLIFAALAGARIAVAAVAAYLLQGVLGAPFFAGGASGIAVLTGPTGGYLLGFLLAAAAVGALSSRARSFPGLLAVMALGHLVVLVPGVLRLSMKLGLGGAFEPGFLRLLPGAVLKTALAAAVVWLLRRPSTGRSGAGPPTSTGPRSP